MKNKNLFLVSSIVFGSVSFLHLLRLVNGWTFQVASWNAPMWLSWVAFVFAGYLSYSFFNLK